MWRTFLLLLIINSLLFAQPSDYFQQQVKYKIDVTLHPEDKTYSGTEILTYKNNSNQTLEYIWFHFYPNAYKDESTPYAKQQERFRSISFHFSPEKERGYLDLTSAKVENQELKWEYKKDAIDEIKIYLAEPLKPGGQIALQLQFAGKFPKLDSRMTYFGDNYFSATQWYPKVVVFDREGWHPDSYLDMGEFYGEFGDFDVSITLPKNFVIDATGMLQDNPDEEQFIKEIIESTNEFVQIESKKERKKFIKDWIKERTNKTDYSNTKTVRFIAKNVHDFAWFAGDEYMMYQSTHNDGVLTNVLVQPKNAYGWRDVPRYVEQTIWFYGKEVGKYQYPKASVVDGGGPGGSGMEYPMITNISMPDIKFMNLLEMVVMHEVGHNWFYGMLGSDERKETFMDEGLNSFLEYKYMEHFYGFNNLTDFKKLTKINLFEDIGEWHLLQLSYGALVSSRIDQPMNLRSEEYTGISYGGVTYHKGVLMLLALEWLVGPEKFSSGMHTYFEKWSGKHPTSKDFFDIMSQASGMDLDWFYEQWITKTTYNDFVLKKKKTSKTDDGYETKIFVENKGTMKNMPAPVYLITTKGDTSEGRWQGDSKQPVIIQHASPVKKVEINLKKIIFETNYLNNAAFPKFDFNLLAQFPRFDTYPINIYPYYWYEEFEDKSRVGLGFWSGNPIYKRGLARGSFYYATGSDKWGYGFSLTQRLTDWPLNYCDASAGIRDKNGLKNLSLGAKTFYQSPTDSRSNLTLAMTFDKVDLYDPIYSDQQLFDKFKYSTISINGELVFRRMLYRLNARVNIEKTIDVFDSQADYAKLTIATNYYHRISKYFSGRLLFYGGGIWGDVIPKQERIYLGGDIDPKHKRFAFERQGGMAPLRTWTYGEGMNMLGYARSGDIYPSGRAGASVSMELKYRRFSLPAIYITGGTISQSIEDFGSDDFIAETGIKLENGPFTLIMPLYITDPPAGEKHFDFRFFISLTKNISFGL